MLYVELVILIILCVALYYRHTQRTKPMSSATPVGLSSKVMKVKKKVKIYEVLCITAGRHHAWVQSSVGKIRKPLGSIPYKKLRAFYDLNIYGV